MKHNDTIDLRKSASAIYLACSESVAKDVSDKLIYCADEIDELRCFVVWLTGCGYDFTQHEYYNQMVNKLLKFKE